MRGYLESYLERRTDLHFFNPLHDKLLLPRRLPPCHHRPETSDAPLETSSYYGMDIMRTYGSHLVIWL